MSSPPDAVAWFKKEKGSDIEERVTAQQWLDAENRCNSLNNAMECFCSSSRVYSCSIKSVKATNDGQSWRCKAYYGQLLTESNVFILRLIFPLTSLTILPEMSVAYPVFNVLSTFTCITSLSRPAASIQWFNDNRNITNRASYSTKDDIARSDLQYTSNVNGYSDGNISCAASYEFGSIRNIITANITIRVQFPVSEPILTINNIIISTAFAIREGRLVHLNCFSTGYPQTSYQWVYPVGQSAGADLNITFTRKNGSVSCRAHNVMRTLDGINTTQATEKNSALNSNVLYPPVITKLSNKDENVEIIDSTIRVQRGDNINIFCTSDANPPASVLWNGQLIPSPSLTVKGVQHDAVWTCKATNSMTEFDNATSTATVTRNVSARVLYGPDVPTITYTIQPKSDARWNASNDPIRVIVGSTIILMCSVDSVPNSTYSWDSGHEASLITIVNVTRTTHPRHTCTAKNDMDTTFKGNVIGKNYSSANLDILFGPANIAVKYNNDTPIEHAFKVIEGWSCTIVCSTGSNPAPRYAWFGPVAQEGDVLIIRNVRTDMNRNVTCKAENTMVDSVGKSVNGTAHVTVSMDVLYSPEVQRLQNQTVLLNTSLTVVCNLTDVGNPPASNFSWIRKDNNRTVGTENTLTIKRIGLTDEGEYRCIASNRMQPTGDDVVYGLSQSTFSINVEYGAYVQVFKANESHNSINVNQGETVDLLCYADGDPEPVVRVMNTTRGNESTLVEIEGPEAKYRIQQAKCEYDTGNYTCSADNRYNQGRQLFVIFVYCSPRASPFSPSITTLYRAPNDSVLFTFTIIAYPKPTSQDVVWYKRDADSWRVVSEDTNFLVTISDKSMQIQLKIFHVQLDDYTDYMVHVSNKLGSTVEVFNLKALSKPEVPKELQVSRTGNTELIVEWIPGFNGGESQTFTIRYKAIGDGSWIVIPINISQYIWTIDGLKTGTEYQIQMMAQNKIGKSDWTQEINITTLVNAVSSGSSTFALVGAVGGVFGVGVVIIVSLLIWRYRSNVISGLITTGQCPTNRNSLGKYEDLVQGQDNNDASVTDGSYESCRTDSSQPCHANQYETLVELECREYSKISVCNSQQENTTSAKMSTSRQTDVSAKDPEYENLQMFTL